MPSADKSGVQMLHAGVARANITPALGVRMWGYTAKDTVSAESVERDLTATAVVLSACSTKAVLIGCDLLAIQSPHVDRIRRRIAERLGISADNVLINTSHTHAGPMLPGWMADSPRQQELQQNYLQVLEETLVGIAALADCRLEPARIGAGKGSAAIGINRRERLPDGRIIIGNNPDGPVDRDVDVIRLDSLSGKPLATIFAASAHPIVLGFKTSHFSPDFVGPAREIIETTTGAPSVFLQGAAGNVSPICGVGSGGPEEYENLHRIGTLLGGEVLRTWAGIRTHNRMGARRVIMSVAPASTWEYEPLPDPCIERFAVGARTLTLPMAALPCRKTAVAELEVLRERLAEVRRGESLADLHVAERLVQQAELVLETIDAGEPVTRKLIVWALCINGLGIVAVNGEAFAELSIEVKRRSPLAHTIFLGYSNGCLGYFPTAEAFDEGGMEVCESVKNYMLPAAFTPQWGPTIVETSIELLRSLKSAGDPGADVVISGVRPPATAKKPAREDEALVPVAAGAEANGRNGHAR